ncbi:MAG TPA: glycosyltransferase 87 family protein, partial [Chloroflexota bacterium]|nr:glycosyltransferase 87 family protein [Chloroflexota bacterium]
FPGWLGIELAVWELSRALKTPFWWLIRLTIVAADVLTCFAVWWAARRAGGPSRGRWAAALYALSPIAILISGHHGQFDALPTLFSVLAAGLLLGAAPRPWAAGLLLGLAVALKPSPALLVPVFMRAPGLSWRGRLAIGALAGAVVLAVTGPFLLADAASVYRNVVGYPGLNDQGLGGLLRSLWLYRAKNIYLPGAFGAELATTTRWTALALVAFAIVVLWRQRIPRVAAAVYLAFLGVFGGVSTQYLVWPLAWLLVSDLPLRWAVLYSLGATAGALGFYLVYWPQILVPGRWTVPAVQNVGFFVAGQATSLLATWATFGAALAPGLRGRAWRNPLLWVALLAFLAAARPVAIQVAWLAGEWLKFRG